MPSPGLANIYLLATKDTVSRDVIGTCGNLKLNS